MLTLDQVQEILEHFLEENDDFGLGKNSLGHKKYEPQKKILLNWTLKFNTWSWVDTSKKMKR